MKETRQIIDKLARLEELMHRILSEVKQPKGEHIPNEFKEVEKKLKDNSEDNRN